MRKLKIRDADIMKLAILNEIERSEESRYDHRFHGVLLVSVGMNCYEVASLLGRSPRTIQYWVKRFEEIGFKGLWEGERLGRPSHINNLQLKQEDSTKRKGPRTSSCTRKEKHECIWSSSYRYWSFINPNFRGI